MSKKYVSRVGMKVINGEKCPNFQVWLMDGEVPAKEKESLNLGRIESRALFAQLEEWKAFHDKYAKKD